MGCSNDYDSIIVYLAPDKVSGFRCRVSGKQQGIGYKGAEKGPAFGTRGMAKKEGEKIRR